MVLYMNSIKFKNIKWSRWELAQELTCEEIEIDMSTSENTIDFITKSFSSECFQEH